MTMTMEYTANAFYPNLKKKVALKDTAKKKKSHQKKKVSCPCGSGSTIKKQISTSVVCCPLVAVPKHVLVLHRTHVLIVDV
jgi:hypothetical protein